MHRQMRGGGVVDNQQSRSRSSRSANGTLEWQLPAPKSFEDGFFLQRSAEAADLMKTEVRCRPKVDDKDVNIKNERAGGSQNKHQQITEIQAVIGSASNVQKGFRFLAEEVLTNDATTARSKALQQAIRKGVWQAQRFFQKQQPHQAQPQNAAVVCWDRFLPHQQLQVLLVEDDDATRHIVGALLRKCSFEVTPASNGLLAWELLMDPTNRIDLVLTEVVMPCLSGIGLLGRIMNHGALKHIPVIMMSSNDSMNVVFKCLSNGAVDFLVKPVRKNELKNLWQHVWRRCHSSSASRSASSSHTQKPVRRNDATNFNEPGNNEDDDKASSDLNIRGGSDNGSCTQSPWTKTDLGAEIGHQVNKLHSNGHRTNAGLQLSVKLEQNFSLQPKRQEDNGVDSKEKTNATCLELVWSHENSGTAASVADAPHTNDASICPQGINQRVEDLMGSLKEQDSNEEQDEASEDEDGLIEKPASNSPRSKDKLSNSNSPPPFDSSSIQLKESSKEDDQIGEKEARGVIHSSVSAFSRYNAQGNFTPLIARTGPANTHKPLVEFGEGGLRTLSVSSIATLHKESVMFPHGGSENITSAKSPLETNTEVECLAQVYPPSQQKVPSKAVTPLSPPRDSSLGSKQAGIADDLYLGAGPQAGENEERKDYRVSYEQDEIIYSHSNNHHQFHHHSHHHHHHHHIQHHYYHASEEKLRTRTEALQPNDQTVTCIRDGAPRWGSSCSMENGTEVNIDPSGSSRHGSNVYEVGSKNRSGSGSNNGSTGVPGVAAVLPIEGQDLKTRIDEDNDLSDVNGVSGSTENSLSRREAALTKFRQKRKERCFEKKVLYQSRKRLAEQRPRVRGQFAKQTMYEPTVQEPERS